MARISSKIERTCLVCSSKFFKSRAWDKKIVGGSKFCSRKCLSKSQQKRTTKICKICGDNFSIQNCYVKRYFTCANESCRLENRSGKNNPNYIHGKAQENTNKRNSTSKKYKSWRQSVFIRDNYTCQFCNKRGGNLQADHIKPWAYFKDLRYSVDNGRVLCLECHQSTFKDLARYRAPKWGKMSDFDIRTIGIDFDKTIATNSGFPDYIPGIPLPGAVEAIKKLNSMDLKILIFTARPWIDQENIEGWCFYYGIKFDQIVCGKPLMRFFIDDKNIEFSGDWDEALKKAINFK